MFAINHHFEWLPFEWMMYCKCRCKKGWQRLENRYKSSPFTIILLTDHHVTRTENKTSPFGEASTIMTLNCVCSSPDSLQNHLIKNIGFSCLCYQDVFSPIECVQNSSASRLKYIFEVLSWGPTCVQLWLNNVFGHNS